MARGYLYDGLPGLGSRRSLASRGQFLNTFAGITLCVSFSLLALGGYLIEEQFQNPVQAQSVALLFAALLIATATTLLFCLLHSSRRSRHHVAAWPLPASWENKTIVVARCNTGTRVADAGGQSHGRFVDRTLIRIRR
jgi:hypothetical protein